MIQIFNHGSWHDAAELTFASPKSGRQGSAILGYDGNYAIEWMLDHQYAENEIG